MTNKERNIIEYCEKVIKDKKITLFNFPNCSITKDFKKDIIHLSKVKNKILKKYNLI